MASNVLFSLYSWKSRRKSFELIIRLDCKNTFEMTDFYSIYFVIKKLDNFGEEYNKTLESHCNRRFTNYFSNFWSFYNVLSFHPEAQNRFREFHDHKIDILGLKVLKIF